MPVLFCAVNITKYIDKAKKVCYTVAKMIEVRFEDEYPPCDNPWQGVAVEKGFGAEE